MIIPDHIFERIFTKCIQEYADINQPDQDWESLLKRDFPEAMIVTGAFETYKRELQFIHFLNKRVHMTITNEYEESQHPWDLEFYQ